MQYDCLLDASELPCPLPLVKAKKILRSMQSGQVLQVISTDSASKADFQAFARQTAHTLLDNWEQEGRFYFLIQV